MFDTLKYIEDRIVRSDFVDWTLGEYAVLEVAGMAIHAHQSDAERNFRGFTHLTDSAKMDMEVERAKIDLMETVLMAAYGTDWESHI